MDNKSKGKHAEDVATDFYLEKGFEIVVRNYRYSRGEIDLIVKKTNLLVFVEVKYRSSTAFGHPEESVSPNQQRSIMETADHYISMNNWNKSIRFDIIAIDGENLIEHFPDAFY